MKRRFRKGPRQSSSPPEFLPKIDADYVDDDELGYHHHNDEAPASASLNSSSLSTTPPMSTMSQQQQQQYHHGRSPDTFSSRSSSLSASPNTGTPPRKQWEVKFKNFRRLERREQRRERFDSFEQSSNDDSSSNPKSTSSSLSRVQMPDFRVSSSQQQQQGGLLNSLPPDYVIPNNMLSGSPKMTLIPPIRGHNRYDRYIGKSIMDNRSKSIDELSQKRRCNSEGIDDDANVSNGNSILKKNKFNNDNSNSKDGISNNHRNNGPIMLDHLDSDDDFSSDLSAVSPSNQHAVDKEEDKGVRGGSIFARFKKRDRKNSKDSSSSDKRKGNDLLDNSISNSSSHRRVKSFSSLLDDSIRGGIGSRDADGNVQHHHDHSGSGKHRINYKSSKRDHKSKDNSRYVIGPDGVLREMKSKNAGRQKEKKLVFTEFRNAANAKESSTAYLGEEKSTHKGDNFGPQPFSETDRSLSTVKEEIDAMEASQTALIPIDGCESWSEKSKNLIFPAIVAMCRPSVFEIFQSGSTVLNDNSFGTIALGSVQMAREFSKDMKNDEYKWRMGVFELRQNYLLEYLDKTKLSNRPCGYVFLQNATVNLSNKFEHALRLEFNQHQSTTSRTAVIIRLTSGLERQKWLGSLLKAAKLTIEDLYEYDASDEEELGRGRYATVRPGRRRRNNNSNELSSTMGSMSIEGNSSNGILKKRPSFSTFQSVNILSQKDYECALKIIDKKLFWKHVKQGNERADSIVRETCVQATLIAQAREHKGFLRLKSFFETRDKVVLELELLEGTDLYQYIKRNQPMSEIEAYKIMNDILSCIVVMKNLGIAHRDLKPANILMANKSNRYGMRINVGDFGNATFVGNDGLVRGRCGTVGYVAPEIFLAAKNSGYENKIDEFSAGVILYVLLCGYEPFYGETEKELIKENTKALVEFPEEDWQSISLEGRDLVEKLLISDPSKRMEASKALQHPWITRRNRDVKEQGDDADSFQAEGFACAIS